MCSNDLTAGVRATAQMMTSTRTTLTDSVLLANAVMASHVLPAVRSHIPGARSEFLRSSPHLSLPVSSSILMCCQLCAEASLEATLCGDLLSSSWVCHVSRSSGARGAQV